MLWPEPEGSPFCLAHSSKATSRPKHLFCLLSLPCWQGEVRWLIWSLVPRWLSKQHNRPPSTWEMFIALETQWRSQGEAKSFLISGVNNPFKSIKVKGFGSMKAHFLFTYLVLTSASGATRDWCSTFSSFHCCSTFLRVRGKVGSSFSPEQKSRMLSHFHPSLPKRQWGKEVSCQQMLW